MVEEAIRGLEWRKEHGRGVTEVGVARARDIKNRKDIRLPKNFPQYIYITFDSFGVSFH